MNVPRLLEIATWLADGAKHSKVVFNMQTGVSFEPAAFDKKNLSDCQTSCCIAGAAVQFFDSTWLSAFFAKQLAEGEIDADDPELPFYGTTGVFGQAQELLDLTNGQAEALFTPGGRFAMSFEEYNDPAWAARTVCYLIATGKADWSATKETP